MPAKSYYAFAFGKADFENNILVPLSAAFRHFCMAEWCKALGTTHKFFDHWSAEVDNLTDTYLEAVVQPTTLQPAGRIKVYLRVVARLRDQDEHLQNLAFQHYCKSFPEQHPKTTRLPKVVIDAFWHDIHLRTKAALVDTRQTGRIWLFESVFSPISA
ncbi:MAG: hypothetical protein WC505_06850 [Patescibacteria group bacterium]